MKRSANHTDATLYDLLAILKSYGVLLDDDLSDDEIRLANRLVEMKLATKVNTALETFYYYGTPETEDKK